MREFLGWRNLLIILPALPGALVGLVLLARHHATAPLIPALAVMSLPLAFALVHLHRLTGELRRREARARMLVQGGSDGVTIVDAQGTIRYTGPAAQRIIGVAPEELVGTSITARLDPRDRDEVAAAFRALSATPQATRSLTTRLRRADGCWRTLEVSGTNMLGEPGIDGIVVNYRDITDRTRAEGLLAGQTALLERIAQDAPLDQSLTALARQIEAANDGALVSILLLSPDGRSLCGIAAPSLPPPFIDATRAIPVREGAGSCGTAAARGAAVIVADIATDPLWADYRDLALGCGLRACWSLPISTPGGKLLGTFAVYHRDPRRPHAEEWQHLDRAVNLAALAIERDRAAAALRDSERDYRTLLEQAADAIIIVGPDGTINRVNDRASALTGYSRDELLGRPVGTIIPRDEQGEVAQRIATLTAVPRVNDRLLVRRDGSHLPVEVSVVRLDDGRVQIIARDITARREAEAALGEAEARFRVLVEQIPAMTYIAGVEVGITTYVSPQVETLLGYTQEEWLADPQFWADTLHPDDRERALAFMATIRATGEAGSLEYRLRARDGRYVWVSDEATLLRDDRGRPLALQGIVTDVTARRVAEEAVREREERFRLVARATNDAIWDWDLRTDALWWSKAIQEILGYRPEEIGTAISWWEEHIHPAERGEVIFGIRAAIAGDAEHWSCDYRLRRADGSYALVLDRGFILRDETGRATRMLGSVQDVTARRSAEEGLRRSEANLAAAQRIAHLGSWSYDLATATGHWSDELYRICGVDRATFVPTLRSFFALIHPDERAVVRHALFRTIAGEHGYDQEFRIVRADGTIRTVHAQAELTRGADDRPAELLGALLDITERVQAAAALRRAEAEARRQARELALLDRVRATLARELELPALLDALVNAVAVAFDTINVGVLLREGDRLIGRAHVDLANRPLSLHISEGIVGRCARSGVPILVPDVSDEPLFIGAPGQRGSEICIPLFAEGQVIGVLNVERQTDPRLDEADLGLLGAIGEQAGIAIGRARLHSALAASEARHRAVVDTALDAVITTNAEDAIESFNQGAERIFGYRTAEVIGRPLSHLLPSPLGGQFRTGLAPHLVRGLTNLGGRPIEMVGRRSDGSEFPAEVVLAEVAVGNERFFTGVVRDISDRRAYEDRLHHQAHHDPLTGLPNRALFLDRLNQALSRARRDGKQRAVLFIDLDRFKDVNDSWGHDAGDRLLVAVTARLRTCLRDADTLARQGGDEFTILLEDIADTAEAARIADRLATVLDRPFPIEGQEHRITASIGIVITQGSHQRAEDLLRDADIAMYRAKEGGKARYAIFDPAMQDDLRNRLNLERDLRQALQGERFILHYQPIVDLASREIVRVEALIRWHHPQRGFISPNDFIPIAEESGLIRPLGRWVLREACRQARAWETAGTPIAVAVNLTAHEFQGAGLLDEVASALADTGLSPQYLLLEITESAAMHDVAATTATLAALRRHGVRVAIDDFGTGYSSLAYLKRLPVDTLKIDHAFIDGLGDDPEDTAIVEAIITLAHTLGLQVVAEGVETAAQAAQLRALGCESAQGYLFARPLPAPDLRPLLHLDDLTTDDLALIGQD